MPKPIFTQNAAHHSRCQTCRKLQRRAAQAFSGGSSTAASRAHIMTSGRKYGWMPTAKKASTGMARGGRAAVQV
ncbi:MAG: hypothetical protein ACLVHY_05255 [Gemmiger sp.]